MSDNQVIQKKKIFFIRHPDGPMENIAKFLKHRDYDVYLASDLKQAFSEIIKIQPEYVFICLDHPNEKVASIPKLLLQSLMVTMIPYVHGTSMVSIRLIQSSNFEYKLFPPNTGPSTLRLLNKIAKDEARGSISEPSKKDSGQIINATRQTNSNDSKIYRIDGNNPNQTWNLKSSDYKNQSDEIIISQKNENQSYMIGGGQPKQVSGQFDPSQVTKESVSHLNGNGLQTKNQYAQSSSIGFDPAAAHANSPTGFNPLMPGGNPSGGFNPAMNSRGNSSGGLNPRSSNGGLSAKDSAGGYGQGPVHNPLAKDSQNSSSQSGSPFNPSNHEDKQNLHVPTANPFKRTNSIPTKLGKGREPTNFEKGTEDALNQIAQEQILTRDEEIRKIEIVSSATCFAIDSEKFTGYLVAAFAGEKKIDTQFLKLMKLRLKDFLSSRGEAFDPSERMDIQIIEVDFESWAIQQAEFLKKSVHEGKEVAMAFFPTQTPRLNILASESKDMLKVSIDDIDENKAVKFNVYIYLTINQRYVLYTPKGGRIGSEQKTRLKKKGVSDVHFHKNEAHSFKTYQAEKYLNEKITEFHTQEQLDSTNQNKSKKAA